MKSILVQMSEHGWTMQAVHLACSLARSNQTNVILLHLIAVTHPGYLGTPYGGASTSRQERQNIEEYAATAEDYQVDMSVQPIQYVTMFDAVADAAEILDADVVFANIHKSPIPYWRHFVKWRLEHRLSSQSRQLFTLVDDKEKEHQADYLKVPISYLGTR